jgi:ABC-type dipeptide/oligopeptide/nickel transport system permease subunit
MKALRTVARGFLALTFLAALAAPWIAPRPYDHQYRQAANAEPSRDFPLGSDDLGRDRLSRLLVGAQVSLLLAPAAAAVAVLLAALVGITAGYLGGAWDRVMMGAVDLLLALPWLFLLLAVRSLLPLNVAPQLSVALTFLLLGMLGWAAPARVVRASVRTLLNSEFLLQARAFGSSPARLLTRQLPPNLAPVLAAQFCISVPAFVLAEASLGLLGLGVAEPLPSLGSLLRELENLPALRATPAQIAGIMAPAIFLVAVVCSFQLAFPLEEIPS